MNVLILAAGHSFSDSDYENYPLCIAEINGLPLIEILIKSCNAIGKPDYIVACRDQDIRRYHLDNVIELLAPGSQVLRVPENARGAACTALLASGQIDNDTELLIINGNELLDADFLSIVNDFRGRKLDAGTVTFSSVHPRYSYVRLNSEMLVVEAAEKNPISRMATVGFYWFARGSDFVRAAQDMIRKDASVNDLFFICPALNELVLRQASIGTFSVDASQYHPLKTEHQVTQYDSALNLRGAA